MFGGSPAGRGEAWFTGPCFCPQGTPENPGINQRALQLLFSEVQEKASDWEYTITVSAAEIYNEVLRWEALARGTGLRVVVVLRAVQSHVGCRSESGLWSCLSPTAG